MTDHIFRTHVRAFAVIFFLISIFWQLAATASGSQLAKPTGQVILKIHGKLAHTNADDGAHFDYAMLKNLGLTEVSVDTPWTPAGTRFEGILSKTLLELVGAEGAEILAKAADGYTANIPFEDLAEHNTLLALSRNGERMRLKSKGPVWIVYPNEGRPDVVEATLNSRMVWQLKSLTVL